MMRTRRVDTALFYGMPSMLTGLWRQPDFVKLWTGHTISRFGSEISQLAIPFTAVLVLNASPSQMGLLAAVEFAPFLLLSLFAGVWVDRLPRKRILIVGDFGRALLLGSIPLAAITRTLSIEQLYVVGFCTGVLTVFFDVADQAFLPALVSREHLVEGNSKLEVSRSVAQIVGPGVAGALVQLVTAPIAVAVDAASFIASVLCLLPIRAPEPPRPPAHEQSSMLKDIKEGLAVVVENPLLRSIAFCTGSSNLSSNAMVAIFVLYMTRQLGLEPALQGLIFAASGPGALLGALFAGRIARAFGLGRAIIGSIALIAVASLLVPLARGPVPVVVGTLMLSAFAGGVCNPVYNINQVSLRQAITPDRLQGRMNASMRFIVWGTIPLGALLGGWLGDAIGLWPTLVVAALGNFLAPLFVLLSPVRDLRDQPRPVVEPVPAG
jgi:predicted MFS family arabinose efflux permease